MDYVTSADGTRIAYERTGSGPALILVEAAAHYRAFSSFDGLAPLLAESFTVYRYDRRGRGDSGDRGVSGDSGNSGDGDTPHYAVEREVADLAALIDAAGGPALVHGFSSGALLALHAAAAGLAISRLTLLEPPFAAAEERPAQRAFTARLRDLVAQGDHDGALEHFLADVVPEDLLAGMRTDRSWAAMAAVAPTLVYDSLLGEATTPELLARVTVPALVLDSDGTDEGLRAAVAALAAALPSATTRTLPGDWHGIADATIAPVLTTFLTADRDSGR